MIRIFLRILVVLLILAGMGGTIYFALESAGRKKVIAQLEADLDRSKKTETLLKRKYSEEKAKADSIQRAKLMAEGQKRQVETEIDTLEKRIAELTTEKKTAIEKADKELAAAQAEVNRLKDAIDKWRVRHDELTARIKEGQLKIGEQEEAIATRDEKIAGLASDLERELRRAERYLVHNKKMADISKSILIRYDEKGIHKSLIKVEPFTQIRKVELEKIIQEYLDSIDNEMIREQGN